MRSARAAPLLAAYVLLAAALFAGGATGNGSLLWLGAGALGTLLVTFVRQGVAARLWVLLPLAALALWCGASIAWSTLPDRSWEYADRTLVYLLFAALGLCLASRRRMLALGLSGLLGAVAVWALAGKALPVLAGSYSTIARLSAPVGLWNQLALVGDFALPL